MLKGRDLILATIKYSKEDRKKSWLYTLSTLLLLCGSLSATLFFTAFFGRLSCSILSGLLIVRMFVIYHDYLHEAILFKSRPASILFYLFGIYVLAPKTVWQRTHNYHHKHNSKFFKLSIGSFPIYSKTRFKTSSREQQLRYLFVRHPLIIAFGYLFTFLFGMCIEPLIRNFKKHPDSLIALLVHATIQVFLLSFFGWQGLLFFCLLPHLLASAIGSYLFYVQHNFKDVYFYEDQNWTYADAALVSSSYLKLNPFMNWVTANIGYHHIHHLNPRIPFYRLPETMQRIAELQHAKTTTLKFTEVVFNLRLKVWDEKKGVMTGVD